MSMCVCLFYPSENDLFSKDDPAKGSMHSFLMSTNSQQDIATLDAKVCCDLAIPWIILSLVTLINQ